MRDVVRRYVQAGLDTLGAERAEGLAHELMEWSKRSTERIVSIVQREVKRQLRLAGAATQDELRELRKRVRTLERRLEKAEKADKTTTSRAASSKTSSSKTRGSATSGKKASSRRARPKA